MLKISPIAAYLTENKAITKREGNNVWHFYNPQGLYLGKQVKIEQGTSTAYVREIFGEGLKRLLYECKVIGQKLIYFKHPPSPIGIGILPTHSYILTHSVDYASNTVESEQKVRQIKNPMELIAIDENTQVGIFDIEAPFEYEETIIQHTEAELDKKNRIQHTIH